MLLIVECCPTHLQWLWEVARYWRELEHAFVHVDPDLPKHSQWVTRLVSMQAMEELGHLRTDPHEMGLCIIVLKRDVGGR
jgi:hypothetical protein